MADIAKAIREHITHFRPWKDSSIMDIFDRAFVLVVVLSFGSLILLDKTKSEQEQQAKPAPAPKLKLEGQTNWGEYSQAGPKQFTLDNHPTWYGIGTVREDGKVFILWTLRSDNSPCPGVYIVQPDGSLVGCWGYSHDTKLEENGELTGNVRSDRVFQLPPPMGPDF